MIGIPSSLPRSQSSRCSDLQNSAKLLDAALDRQNRDNIISFHDALHSVVVDHPEQSYDIGFVAIPPLPLMFSICRLGTSAYTTMDEVEYSLKDAPQTGHR